MTTAEVPATIATHAEDPLSRDLEDLHVRAQQVAAQLEDIYARLALLQKQVQRHRQRR